MDAVPELDPPSCPKGAGGEGSDHDAVVARGSLRGREDSMAEGAPVETFELVRRGCLYVLSARQEWALGITELEVMFDEHLLPLRAWKRMTLPEGTPEKTAPEALGANSGSSSSAERADVRRYEVRTPEVTMTRRSLSGEVSYAVVKGKHPTAVIGPGRGLLTAWIRRAGLAVGEKVREPVLDFREMLEVVREVTLKREDDRFDETFGRTVRVYTVYGREAVFTDENDVVIGDLAGLKPSERVGSAGAGSTSRVRGFDSAAAP